MIAHQYSAVPLHQSDVTWPQRSGTSTSTLEVLHVSDKMPTLLTLRLDRLGNKLLTPCMDH